jgi:hypothetical protein
VLASFELDAEMLFRHDEGLELVYRIRPQQFNYLDENNSDYFYGDHGFQW